MVLGWDAGMLVTLLEVISAFFLCVWLGCWASVWKFVTVWSHWVCCADLRGEEYWYKDLFVLKDCRMKYLCICVLCLSVWSSICSCLRNRNGNIELNFHQSLNLTFWKSKICADSLEGLQSLSIWSVLVTGFCLTYLYTWFVVLHSSLLHTWRFALHFIFCQSVTERSCRRSPDKAWEHVLLSLRRSAAP